MLWIVPSHQTLVDHRPRLALTEKREEDLSPLLDSQQVSLTPVTLGDHLCLTGDTGAISRLLGGLESLDTYRRTPLNPAVRVGVGK